MSRISSNRRQSNSRNSQTRTSCRNPSELRHVNNDENDENQNPLLDMSQHSQRVSRCPTRRYKSSVVGQHNRTLNSTNNHEGASHAETVKKKKVDIVYEGNKEVLVINDEEDEDDDVLCVGVEMPLNRQSEIIRDRFADFIRAMAERANNLPRDQRSESFSSVESLPPCAFVGFENRPPPIFRREKASGSSVAVATKEAGNSPSSVSTVQSLPRGCVSKENDRAATSLRCLKRQYEKRKNGNLPATSSIMEPLPSSSDPKMQNETPSTISLKRRKMLYEDSIMGTIYSTKERNLSTPSCSSVESYPPCVGVINVPGFVVQPSKRNSDRSNNLPPQLIKEEQSSPSAGNICRPSASKCHKVRGKSTVLDEGHHSVSAISLPCSSNMEGLNNSNDLPPSLVNEGVGFSPDYPAVASSKRNLKRKKSSSKNEDCHSSSDLLSAPSVTNIGIEKDALRRPKRLSTKSTELPSTSVVSCVPSTQPSPNIETPKADDTFKRPKVRSFDSNRNIGEQKVPVFRRSSQRGQSATSSLFNPTCSSAVAPVPFEELFPRNAFNPDVNPFSVKPPKEEIIPDKRSRSIKSKTPQFSNHLICTRILDDNSTVESQLTDTSAFQYLVRIN